MNFRSTVTALGLVLVMVCTLGASDCDSPRQEPVSASGVHKAQVTIPTGSDNLTTEQRNVRDRLLMDNKPGSIKHLYVISAYTGQVIIYSTVRGKVTSSGKRLTPNTVAATDGQGVSYEMMGIPVQIGGQTYRTPEVLEDDGSYGHSEGYLFWWDTKGVYHQHYLSGGQILHISDQPLAVKNIIINMELTKVGE